MKSREDTREKILRAAAELIGESAGSIETITVRAIAERANVGVGLINYHFQTKEHLIELCVQQLIGSFIAGFKPDVGPGLKGAAYLAAVVKNVADFLAANPAVSQISILGDFKSPEAGDNTMKTVRGLLLSLQGLDFPERDKALLMFAVTSVLQGIFLRRELSGALFGYDFNDKTQRDAMIDLIVNRLM
ncbi:transcriptional regulator, TetR family [Sporobacter termitidis DSM 10068]|uniref:Transcriptional regulator, TetR family n=1 Tax=Sporobacter termitidis DSM 10068 TaxID=1123282 RepID=A0A1M5TXW5_9FIRM|nr:TetR/AcrR family transcriptional regulator [Sporobacter termitidis]SHH55675.1 transcriptional regulator, TetR family [Sporobacter termitidis DSM 10068]